MGELKGSILTSGGITTLHDEMRILAHPDRIHPQQVGIKAQDGAQSKGIESQLANQSWLGALSISQ